MKDLNLLTMCDGITRANRIRGRSRPTANGATGEHDHNLENMSSQAAKYRAAEGPVVFI